MSRFPFALCSCAALAVALLPLELAAGDWAHWGGDYARNMAAAEKCPLPESFVADPPKPGAPSNVKWVAELGARTYGNPVVAGGRIFVGVNDARLSDPRFKKTGGGLLLCLEEATGKQLWRLPIPRFKNANLNFNQDDMRLGLCAAVAVEGERLYLLTNRGEVLCLDVDGQADGNDGPFSGEGRFMTDGEKDVALNKNDGDIIWRHDMIRELPVWPQDASSGAPLIHGDYVYVPTSNGTDLSHFKVPLPDAPSLIALDKRTGRLVARDDEKIGRRLYHGQWSSPAKGVVDDRPLIFYGAGDGFLYAFEPLKSAPPKDQVATLKKVWAYECNPPEYKFRPDGSRIDYQRLYGPQRNNTRGEGPSEIISTPVFHNGRVYVAVGQDTRHGTGKGILTCVDARTGKQVWASREVDRTLSTVSIADGLLYIADYTGNVRCFDAASGRLHWRYDTRSRVWGSTFVADGKVYLGAQDKTLHVLRAGWTLQRLAVVRLRFPSASTPILANGVLYFATDRFLYAVGKSSLTASGE